MKKENILIPSIMGTFLFLSFFFQELNLFIIDNMLSQRGDVALTWLILPLMLYVLYVSSLVWAVMAFLVLFKLVDEESYINYTKEILKC